jgi:hypothetical protein
LVRELELNIYQSKLQQNSGDDKEQHILDEQVCSEEESSEEEEEEEWIDHPPPSCTFDSNLSHTLNMFFDNATLKKSIISMDIIEPLDILNTCAYMLCSLYQVSCRSCWSPKHLDFQCTKTYDEVVAYYNSSKTNAIEEIIRYVLWTSEWKLFAEIEAIQARKKDELLDWMYGMVKSINYFLSKISSR